ncbi:cyclopropane fatty-acyl-phospholipid synthase-like methyltransferase [Rhizobium sp. BK275]|uniref:class I SAM-dependent DNA methyltransferase n=1 Tax=unclassified Rhizobium TaxID=2613769 RepID=UPI00160CB9DE|nr:MULTISPECIES: class I SAM-dependent methyltransferase [unclassified Rhizobium]MBB3393005.1 cyclopropane fatty-acyl-phospholipid synthase-like methyltransferase [Rhizobium sp. BK275]MBB3409641.1 cyclopropane fatty-acyl-phospholipid synthase-like methyltransferase [Rhizobium sp. BK316]
MTRRDDTSAFYDDNAETYATRDRKPKATRLDAFLAALPEQARILELGCGGGQDCAYMLSKGFDVTPTDGSAKLARQAEKLVGRPVKVMRFEDLSASEEFGGVWAEASLLHVPRADLPSILTLIRNALKQQGVFHASFKAGTTEGHDSFGRYYNYPSSEWLQELLVAGGWRDIAINEADGGGYDNKPTRWLYLSASK